MKNKSGAIFLDRDGTILNERGYLSTPDKMLFYKSAFQGLRLLYEKGFKLIIISNQSGVGRGYFTENELALVHAAFRRRLLKQGVWLTGIYYCPHLPTAGCLCRKPRPLLVLRAAKKFNVDPRKSFMIGDQKRDMGLALNIGARGLLVLTGGGRSAGRRINRKKIKVTQNLATAARWIIKNGGLKKGRKI